ncbi:MAG: AraC family transcriptional regulator [Micromonosporaceae bacterium]|nr:AraC family transcriptional regulator [Micromonosporaceae bacterium]
MAELRRTGPAHPPGLPRKAPLPRRAGIRRGAEQVRAWRPAVPGILEVFHAHFVEHAYPLHAHEAWTLLIVDAGAVRYALDRSTHGSHPATVTLLPPHVPHDGRAATADGFRKRVIYLDAQMFSPMTIGAAVDSPDLRDAPLRDRIDSLHRVLTAPGEELEAESRLAFIRERLHNHLTPRASASGKPRTRTAGRRTAEQLRDLLDAHTTTGITLREASARLGAHPTHLVRAFTTAFGLPPHAYLTGRRIDLARRLLLDGRPPAQVATAVGFYDQAHLSRHFRRYLGTTPSRYGRTGRR